MMRRAIRLAKASGPILGGNPQVGAVLVRDGKVIGEGYHRGSGTPHAEIDALANVGGSAEGATLYCTLEPCCHSSPDKHTRPCVPAIIAAGIVRVVAGAIDPNPRVNGDGLTALNQAGVSTTYIDYSKEFALLNEVYIRRITSGLPFVHLKWAQSIDGQIAAPDGSSRWITSPESRRFVHLLRDRYDAIVVASTTARRDNPRLTARGAKGRDPIRILLDSDLSVSPDSDIFIENGAERLVCYRANPSSLFGDDLTRRAERLAQKGVIPIQLPEEDGRLDFAAMLKVCADRGISSILVEGGRALHTNIIGRGLWDKLTAFLAPILIGGTRGSLENIGVERIEDALRLELTSWRSIGPDISVSGYRDIAATFGPFASALRSRRSQGERSYCDASDSPARHNLSNTVATTITEKRI